MWEPRGSLIDWKSDGIHTDIQSACLASLESNDFAESEIQRSFAPLLQFIKILFTPKKQNISNFNLHIASEIKNINYIIFIEKFTL